MSSQVAHLSRPTLPACLKIRSARPTQDIGSRSLFVPCLSKWCKEEGYKCEKDGMNHPTILCGLPKLLAEQRQQKSTDQNKKTTNGRPANNRPNARPANTNNATGNGPQGMNNNVTPATTSGNNSQANDASAQNNMSGSQGETRQNINNI